MKRYGPRPPMIALVIVFSVCAGFGHTLLSQVPQNFASRLVGNVTTTMMALCLLVAGAGSYAIQRAGIVDIPFKKAQRERREAHG